MCGVVSCNDPKKCVSSFQCTMRTRATNDNDDCDEDLCFRLSWFVFTLQGAFKLPPEKKQEKLHIFVYTCDCDHMIVCVWKCESRVCMYVYVFKYDC